MHVAAAARRSLLVANVLSCCLPPATGQVTAGPPVCYNACTEACQEREDEIKLWKTLQNLSPGDPLPRDLPRLMCSRFGMCARTSHATVAKHARGVRMNPLSGAPSSPGILQS
mmetsp:Transcript_628/g.1648  ORF Transcript_628/g.1648 Transcript_628/m.1648 type:complete len:113 (-) Transcript_628:38-376(-)